MGKLKDLQIQIVEAVNDYAVDLNYEISEYIDNQRGELESMAESLAEDMLHEYDLSLDDLDDIGMNIYDIAQEAWDNNVDY